MRYFSNLNSVNSLCLIQSKTSHDVSQLVFAFQNRALRSYTAQNSFSAISSTHIARASNLNLAFFKTNKSFFRAANTIKLCKYSTFAKNTILPQLNLSYSSSSQAFENPEPAKNIVYPMYVTYTDEGTIRVDARKSPQIIGTISTRGVREINQDKVNFRPLRIPGMIVERKDKNSAQVMGFSIFDGHGGTNCSQYLNDHLLTEIENITPQCLVDVISTYRKFGPLWSEYTPESLSRMLSFLEKELGLQSYLTLEERITLAYLKLDLMIGQFHWSEKQGSTACSVLIWDTEGLPFWAKDSNIQIMVANCGDTKAILCDTIDGGYARALTKPHNPSLLSEKTRLEKYGTLISVDSYGEERVMSMVANTRAFGDWLLKPFGIIAEPEITTTSITTTDAAFLVIVCDGVTDVMTDQEIVDCAKGSKTAEAAAKKIQTTAEQLNSLDNLSVVVIRLAGWENPSLVDLTKDFRLERVKNSESMKKFQGVLKNNMENIKKRENGISSGIKIKLINPSKLLDKIFSLKTKAFSRVITQDHLSSNVLPKAKQLSVREIESRIAMLRSQFTMRSADEEIDLGDGASDSGDIISTTELMRLTLNVLGKSSSPVKLDFDQSTPKVQVQTLSPLNNANSNNKKPAISSQSIGFRSKIMSSKLHILLTQDEVERAWQLLGLSLIEHS
ncbi:hypothetical protein BB561_002834 [Smittium simulii]|uniref:PPM-type phosphatase domain-containing protein n=1 Tax=Smittium simulii TaxID=133385 RepID=A0A2T9YNX0_9FUNG|nr:hypothetical protein BB561_002834 [Smittium simulii]